MIGRGEFPITRWQAVDSDEVVVNTSTFANLMTAQPAYPRFDVTDNDGMTALQAVYGLADARLQAGRCGPSTLVD